MLGMRVGTAVAAAAAAATTAASAGAAGGAGSDQGLAGTRSSSSSSSSSRGRARHRGISPSAGSARTHWDTAYQRGRSPPARRSLHSSRSPSPHSGGAGSPRSPRPAGLSRAGCACFVAAAAAATGIGGFAGGGAAFCSGCDCGCSLCANLAGAGSVTDHAVLGLLERVLAGDSSCMWGLLHALQQVFPVAPPPAAAAAAGGGAATQRAAGCQAAAGQRGSATGPQLLVPAAPRCGVVTVQPLQGASWRQCVLSCSAADLDRWVGRAACVLARCGGEGKAYLA
jgi:hypothetical protein